MGLTSCQARVYLTLVQSGISTVNAISKVSKVSRQDIYRLADSLQKLGLVEKIISRPVSFRAIPIDEGLSILLERKVEETNELRALTKEIIQNLADSGKPTVQQEAAHFSLLSGKEALVTCAVRATENAQKSIDYISSSSNFCPWLINQEKLFKEALGRGVKIRVILDKLEDEQSARACLRVQKNFSIHVRYVPTVPRFRMGIYDRKDLYMNATPSLAMKSASVLWSNNTALVEALQDYFEILWITALDSPQYPIDD